MDVVKRSLQAVKLADAAEGFCQEMATLCPGSDS